MASVAVFLAVVAVLSEFSLSGTVRLLGTPVEESGGGKIDLLAAGAYTNVYANLLAHPEPIDIFPKGFSGDGYFTTLIIVQLTVTFTGKLVHTALALWEGRNALDAVVLAYTRILMLQQQIKLHERIHGITTESGKRLNIVPSTASLLYFVHAKTYDDVIMLSERVEKCFEGAVTSMGC